MLSGAQMVLYKFQPFIVLGLWMPSVDSNIDIEISIELWIVHLACRAVKIAWLVC